MATRRHSPTAPLNPDLRPAPRLADALRTAFARGYSIRDLHSDVLAGLVVGIVALPLSMALAIASGVAPQHGLYTAIVAGALIAMFGGSLVQVSGPTAAFVVILAPISAKFGLSGLMVASAMAGVLLILMGVARLGRLIEFVPFPVTTGFTAGIAIVIATMQLKDFLGLTIQTMPDHFLERLYVMWSLRHTWHWTDLSVGGMTLTLLVFLPFCTKRVPAPLIALPAAAVAAWLASRYIPGFSVDTVQSRFHGIPQLPPTFIWPWAPPSSFGPALPLTVANLQPLAESAFAIAMLGAIESLLSAVVADGMAGTKHNPDSELVAQGIGNVVAPFFGGFAATGAIARTATAVRSGARSPIAAIIHALFVLLAVLLLAPLLGYLPMAALAAMLLVVAWRMSEFQHVVHTLRVAPRHDVWVLLTCLALTVLFDMVIAVSVGIVLAALLFMQRMASLTGAKFVAAEHAALAEPLPRGVVLYEIAGPLFFGAAQRAMSALGTVERGINVVLLDLRAVPVMDSTGLVALESALDKLHRAHVFTIIAGAQRQPLHLIARAHWSHRRDWLAVYASFDDGVALARRRAIAASENSAATPNQAPHH